MPGRHSHMRIPQGALCPGSRKSPGNDNPRIVLEASQPRERSCPGSRQRAGPCSGGSCPGSVQGNRSSDQGIPGSMVHAKSPSTSDPLLQAVRKGQNQRQGIDRPRYIQQVSLHPQLFLNRKEEKKKIKHQREKQQTKRPAAEVCRKDPPKRSLPRLGRLFENETVPSLCLDVNRVACWERLSNGDRWMIWTWQEEEPVHRRSTRRWISEH